MRLKPFKRNLSPYEKQMVSQICRHNQLVVTNPGLPSLKPALVVFHSRNRLSTHLLWLWSSWTRSNRTSMCFLRSFLIKAQLKFDPSPCLGCAQGVHSKPGLSFTHKKHQKSLTLLDLFGRFHKISLQILWITLWRQQRSWVWMLISGLCACLHNSLGSIPIKGVLNATLMPVHGDPEHWESFVWKPPVLF